MKAFSTPSFTKAFPNNAPPSIEPTFAFPQIDSGRLFSLNYYWCFNKLKFGLYKACVLEPLAGFFYVHPHYRRFRDQAVTAWREVTTSQIATH
jgi:hypothetical protein